MEKEDTIAHNSQVLPVVKNPAANAGDLRDMSSIYEWEYLQYYCLENPMDREAWQATVHGVTKSWTQLKQLSTHACRRDRERWGTVG